MCVCDPPSPTPSASPHRPSLTHVSAYNVHARTHTRTHARTHTHTHFIVMVKKMFMTRKKTHEKCAYWNNLIAHFARYVRRISSAEQYRSIGLTIYFVCFLFACSACFFSPFSLIKLAVICGQFDELWLLLWLQIISCESSSQSGVEILKSYINTIWLVFNTHVHCCRHLVA